MAEHEILFRKAVKLCAVNSFSPVLLRRPQGLRDSCNGDWNLSRLRLMFADHVPAAPLITD